VEVGTTLEKITGTGTRCFPQGKWDGNEEMGDCPRVPIGGALSIGEKIAPAGMALAASADALAHGYCRAVEQGGLPDPFGN